jgi:hypothetical protein
MKVSFDLVLIDIVPRAALFTEQYHLTCPCISKIANITGSQQGCMSLVSADALFKIEISVFDPIFFNRQILPPVKAGPIKITAVRNYRFRSHFFGVGKDRMGASEGIEAAHFCQEGT